MILINLHVWLIKKFITNYQILGLYDKVSVRKRI